MKKDVAAAAIQVEFVSAGLVEDIKKQKRTQ
jgi:hypothetical protein